MPEILFTSTRIVADQFKGTDKETRFVEGRVYDLPADSVDRWIRRGAGTTDPAKIAAAKGETAPVGAPGATPDGPPPGARLVHARKGLWNVVDGDKVLTPGPMPKADAETFLEGLRKPTEPAATDAPEGDAATKQTA